MSVVFKITKDCLEPNSKIVGSYHFDCGDKREDDAANINKTSFLAFPDEDTAQECLTGYYENQDYSYRVHAEKLFELSDYEAEKLTNALIEYNKTSTAGMEGPGDLTECPECNGMASYEELSDYGGLCQKCYRDRARSRGELFD
jgi:hypothetical protein